MNNLPAYLGNSEATPDARLVEQCATGNPGDALVQIVRRHGRVVHSVCRTILGNGHDADDAYQATFLVLIRRAGAVRQPDALASWLCGVAARVSIRAKARRGRAMGNDTSLDGFPARVPDPAEDALTRDESALVVAELGHLPDKYRAPLVLCYLEGQTTEEAAANLNCPVGTFKSRLAKGRDLLRGRLTRRGLALTSMAIAAVLVSSRADAAPPLVITASPAATKLADAEVRAMRSLPGVLWRTGSMVATVLVVVGVVVVFVRSSPFPGERDKGTAGTEAIPPTTAKADPPQRLVSPGTLLVVNQRAATVSVVDLKTNTVRATVHTDACPHEVAVSPKGTTAAVANYGLPFGPGHGNTITLLDVATGKNLKTIRLSEGAAPYGLQWLDEDKLLCTSEAAAALFEIDTKKGEVRRSSRARREAAHCFKCSRRPRTSELRLEMPTGSGEPDPVRGWPVDGSDSCLRHATTCVADRTNSDRTEQRHAHRFRNQLDDPECGLEARPGIGQIIPVPRSVPVHHSEVFNSEVVVRLPR